MPGIVKFVRFLISPGLNLILLSGRNLGTWWPLDPFSRVFLLFFSLPWLYLKGALGMPSLEAIELLAHGILKA